MTTADLDTPAVTVRLDVMESNIRRVQAHLDRHGIANRPHIKTHKISAIGAMQMRGGAMGITCQKISWPVPTVPPSVRSSTSSRTTAVW